MALVVEDGTEVAGADSYVTLAAYQAYGASLGWTLGADSDADEANLRRAFQALNRSYDWKGAPSTATQAGAWPRNGVALRNGYTVGSDEIPRAVAYAQYELAFVIQGGLDPFPTIDAYTTGETIKVGPITISEETTPSGKARVTAVEGLLRPFLASGAGQTALVRG